MLFSNTHFWIKPIDTRLRFIPTSLCASLDTPRRPRITHVWWTVYTFHTGTQTIIVEHDDDDGSRGRGRGGGGGGNGGGDGDTGSFGASLSLVYV